MGHRGNSTAERPAAMLSCMWHRAFLERSTGSVAATSWPPVVIKIHGAACLGNAGRIGRCDERH